MANNNKINRRCRGSWRCRLLGGDHSGQGMDHLVQGRLIRKGDGHFKAAVIAFFHTFAQFGLECTGQVFGRSPTVFVRSRKDLANKGKGCADQLPAGRGDFFFPDQRGRLSFRLAFHALIFSGLGSRPQQDFQAAFELLHTGCQVHLGRVRIRIQDRQGEFMLGRKRRQQTFLQGIRSDQQKDVHRPFLPHAMGSRDTLLQGGWVPGQVHIDHGVGRLEIQPP